MGDNHSDSRPGIHLAGVLQRGDVLCALAIADLMPTALLAACQRAATAPPVVGGADHSEQPTSRPARRTSTPRAPLVVFLFRDSLHASLGPVVGIFLLIVAVIGVLNCMSVARLVRPGFLSLKQKEFTEAARRLGASNARIMFRHILPNILTELP